MAASDDITRHEPPLSRRAHYDVIAFTGSRAQLIEAGILTADDPLPGDPGQRRTYVDYQDDPRRIVMVLSRPAGRFTVRIERTEEEMDADDLGAEDLAAGCVAEAAPRLRLVWSNGRRV